MVQTFGHDIFWWIWHVFLQNRLRSLVYCGKICSFEDRRRRHIRYPTWLETVNAFAEDCHKHLLRSTKPMAAVQMHKNWNAKCIPRRSFWRWSKHYSTVNNICRRVEVGLSHDTSLNSTCILTKWFFVCC